MIHAKKFHMRIRNQNIGIGGWDCPCCAPPRSVKPAYLRAAKRRERQLVKRYIETELV